MEKRAELVTEVTELFSLDALPTPRTVLTPECESKDNGTGCTQGYMLNCTQSRLLSRVFHTFCITTTAFTELDETTLNNVTLPVL
jgi:hypothetical protein